MAEVGTSGVFGTATLCDAGGGQTEVVLSVTANFNRDMPTFITPGTCTSIDKTKLTSLNDTRDGAGTTIIPVPLATLIGSPYELHVDFAPDLTMIAACGAIT